MFFSKKTAIKNTPQHIAIIMDGNARWAKSKGLPTSFGHKIGSENVRKIAESCIELGVKYLTIYSFSSENWDRPKDEVDYLMKLLDEYLEKEIEALIKKNIKILISGNLERLAAKTKNKIKEIEERTKNNAALTLNVAFSYGARQEIIDTTKKIALAVKNEVITVEKIDQEFFEKNLYQIMPDPDLLIRTAGDFRVSNFLLWQIAYSELYFTRVYWPDFGKKDLQKAIIDFNKRERKYGKR